MDPIKQFSADIFQHMVDVKENDLNFHDDFAKQQEMYGKSATIYDEYTVKENYHGHKRLSSKIMELYQPNQRDIKILDYSCGTGLASDCLFENGFTNIDGLDPCKKLLDVARSKGRMKRFYEIGSEDEDSMINSSEYDLVCSSGAFFGSPSYPGFKTIAKICRYVKPGGYIVICTGNIFIDIEKDPEYKYIDDLVKRGTVKAHPMEIFKNYRGVIHETEGETFVKGVFLVYEIL